jgi:threonine aldolase
VEPYFTCLDSLFLSITFPPCSKIEVTMSLVDMRSDTVTRPSDDMWAAMRAAEVGDDVLGDDPTVIRLEQMSAERFNKEAAIFTPSGTMANQIAIRLHTQPGDEVLMEAGAHPFNYEGGAAALISGVQIRPITGTRGILDPKDVATHFRPEDPHYSPVRLVCAEDTANRGGGTPYPVDVLHALADLAHVKGAAAHLDGARIFNAEQATDISVAERTKHFDTVAFCLSKGLGAPVGSLLVGAQELIHKAKWVRKALGGGMRQAGVIAAAGIYALEHHIERLKHDHARAQRLAEGLRAAGYPAPNPASNMLYVDVRNGPVAQNLLDDNGIRCLAVSGSTLRLVTHLDVTDEGIEAAIAAFDTLAESLLPQ